VINTWGMPSVSEAVAYRARSAALVFASGTIYWARALDPLGVPDARIARMTANVLHEALALPVPAGLQSLGPPNRARATMAPFETTVSTVLGGLDAPGGIAVVPGSGPTAGNIVIALAQNPQILMLRPGDGAASVLAGDGIRSGESRYDGVPGAQARFQAPVAVAADASGRVYVADSSMNVIRRIDSDAQHTTTTFAGTLGQAGSSDAIGSAARFKQPDGVAVDGSSSTLYVADTGNHRIRTVDLATGTVATLAGSVAGDLDGPAATARFNYPTGVAVAPDGRVFVLSSASRKVKAILTDPARTVVTLAGGQEGFADGSGSAARIWPQAGIAWAGRFLAVSDGPSLRVRAIVPGTSAVTTQVYTLAGAGRSGYVDGVAAGAAIGLPIGLAAAPDGNLYLADAANGALRVLTVAQ